MNYKLKIEIEEYRGRLEVLKICKHCRWWKPHRIEGEYGLCRKRAPVSSGYLWPTTSNQDSCGEHTWSQNLSRLYRNLSVDSMNNTCGTCKNEFSYFDFIWGDPCPLCNSKLLGENILTEIGGK